MKKRVWLIILVAVLVALAVVAFIFFSMRGENVPVYARLSPWDFTLTDGDGNTLTYSAGERSGDIQPLDESLDDAMQSVTLTLQPSDTYVFSVEADELEDIDAVFGNSLWEQSFEGRGADRITFSDSAGLTIEGEDMSFTAAINYPSGESFRPFRLTARASGEVRMSATGDGILVSGLDSSEPVAASYTPADSQDMHFEYAYLGCFEGETLIDLSRVADGHQVIIKSEDGSERVVDLDQAGTPSQGSADALRIGYCAVDYAFIEDFCAELGLDASQCEEAPIDAVYERLRSGEYDLVIAPEYGDMEGVDATKYASDAIIYRKVQTPLDRPEDTDYTLGELLEQFTVDVDTVAVPVSFYSEAWESFFSYQLCGEVVPFSGEVWRHVEFDYPFYDITSPHDAIGNGLYTGELMGMTFIWPAEYVENVHSDWSSAMTAAVPVSVDGVAPTDETVLSCEYPLTFELYASVRDTEPEDSEARLASEYLASEAGQSFLNICTYVIDLDGDVPAAVGEEPVRLQGSEDGASEEEAIQKVAEDYISYRAAMLKAPFSGGAVTEQTAQALADEFSLSLSQEVLEANIARSEGFYNYLNSFDITLLDLSASASRFEIISRDDGIVVQLYETTEYTWTVPDGGAPDSGIGTPHTITLERAAGGDGYVIVKDEFDEGDITGVSTLPES